MGQRRARKDTAELLSLSKSHCSHPRSGCNSTNSWFLSLKGICLRTFFPWAALSHNVRPAPKEKPRNRLLRTNTEKGPTYLIAFKFHTHKKLPYSQTKVIGQRFISYTSWRHSLFPPPFNFCTVVVTQAENFRDHVPFQASLLMKGFFVASKENQNAMKTHCSKLGIPSNVYFYNSRRGETTSQNSAYFKKTQNNTSFLSLETRFG